MNKREDGGPELSALYSIERGMVACVLLQAVYGGDRSVCHMFPPKDWIVAPDDALVWITDTRANWERVADMSRQDRRALLKERLK